MLRKFPRKIHSQNPLLSLNLPDDVTRIPTVIDVLFQIITSRKGKQELWILSVSFQRYMSGTLHSNETNFRIQAGFVEELVRGTKCDVSSLGGRHHRQWESWHREQFSDYYHRSHWPSWRFSTIANRPFFMNDRLESYYAQNHFENYYHRRYPWRPFAIRSMDAYSSWIRNERF